MGNCISFVDATTTKSIDHSCTGSGSSSGRTAACTPSGLPAPLPLTPPPTLGRTPPPARQLRNATTVSQTASASTAPILSLSARPAMLNAFNTRQVQRNDLVFKATVPYDVSPGQEFQVSIGQRVVVVMCPENCRGGQSLQVTIPNKSADTMPSRTLPISATNANSLASADLPEYLRQETERNAPQTEDVSRITERNHLLPTGESVNISSEISFQSPMQNTLRSGDLGSPRPRESMPVYEVVVPRGISAGQSFPLLVEQQRLLVTCPPHAATGQKIRFNLPVRITQPPQGVESVRLSYDKDGWARRIRVSDMKFQWMRFDQQGDIFQQHRFCAKTSAFVKKLDVQPDQDAKMRAGSLSLVPASEAAVDSSIYGGPRRKELVSYGDIATAQVKTFTQKAEWFRKTCTRLSVEWDEGHIEIKVRRKYLLSDSMPSVMSLSRNDLRKTWKFIFIDEPGVDAGGLKREWFQLVTSEIFNPDTGLWQQSSVNQMCLDINPASDLTHPDDHLAYYRFLGRVIGKALFEQQLISGHMIRHLYKHLLGWPVTFEDLELVDQSIYKSLKDIMQDADNVEHLCLNFTVSENFLGAHNEIPLVEDGENIDVTASNLPEYIECRLKYQMLGRVKPQLTELLLGFFDVIDEPLLTVFDFQELELLMCGLLEINTVDWEENTVYTGEFGRLGSSHPVCKWFWEVVEEYDQEYRARLLQFATGTSGVPSGGFAILQGPDRDSINKFTINGVSMGNNHFPRAQ